MPTLRVEVNDACLAEVAVEGLDMLSVTLGGSRIDEAYATLDMHGMASSTLLIWIAEAPLHAGDRVAVSFNASGTTSHAGKTIEAMFPDEPDEPFDLSMLPELHAKMGDAARVREGYRFVLTGLPESGPVEGATEANEHGFGFSVSWESRHPDSAAVSLHAYTLEALEQQGPMRDFADQHVPLQTWVALQL